MEDPGKWECDIQDSSKEHVSGRNYYGLQYFSDTSNTRHITGWGLYSLLGPIPTKRPTVCWGIKRSAQTSPGSPGAHRQRGQIRRGTARVHFLRRKRKDREIKMLSCTVGGEASPHPSLVIANYPKYQRLTRPRTGPLSRVISCHLSNDRPGGLDRTPFLHRDVTPEATACRSPPSQGLGPGPTAPPPSRCAETRTEPRPPCIASRPTLPDNASGSHWAAQEVEPT